MKIRKSAFIVLLTFPLLAQNPAQDKPQTQDPTQAPVPVADATAPEPDDTQAPEYGGPAILSRGGANLMRMPSENIRIRPFLSISANYDTGITPVTVTPEGKIPNDNSIGVDAQAGLFGYHRWKTATLGLDYRGSYRDYAKNTSYNGTDQNLSLVYDKTLNRHYSVTLRESAGLLSRNFYTIGPYDLINPNFANTPTNDIFDSRTMFLNTMADLTYHKSARLSFNFGADAFLVRRTSSSLYGDTGYRPRMDVAYRTSRFATTGAAYDFTHFEYTKGFGGSDIHTLALTQAFRMGRNWELSMRAGGSRIETLGLALVTIDPVIAAIIGRAQGIAVIYRVNWIPALNASLTRKFHYASFNALYDRGVSPGNGLYLTSRLQTASANFTYSGIRKVNFGASAGYASYGSLTQTVGNYGGYTGGAGVTYQISGALHVVTRYDYRRYSIGQTVFQRDSYRASIGIAFSPKDVPLSLW